jgi:hypothetical protein
MTRGIKKTLNKIRNTLPFIFKEIKLENLFTIEEIKSAAKLSDILVQTSQNEDFLDGRLEDLLIALKQIKKGLHD